MSVFFGVGKHPVDFLAHGREIGFFAMRHEHAFAQPGRRLANHHHLDHAASLIFAIFAPGLRGRGRDRFADLRQELKRAFIEADDGMLLVERQHVGFDHIFHAGNELVVDFGDAPLLLLPRF